MGVKNSSSRPPPFHLPSFVNMRSAAGSHNGSGDTCRDKRILTLQITHFTVRNTRKSVVVAKTVKQKDRHHSICLSRVPNYIFVLIFLPWMEDWNSQTLLVSNSCFVVLPLAALHWKLHNVEVRTLWRYDYTCCSRSQHLELNPHNPRKRHPR